jgi:hypothetical protein
MKNWKSILLLALVFLAGLAVGVVGTRVVVRRVIQQAIAHPQRLQAFVERDLARKLQLDDQQRVALRIILTDTRGQLQTLRQQYQPQSAEIFRGANEKIMALLTPEQQALYEKLKQENHPLWRAMQNKP